MLSWILEALRQLKIYKIIVLTNIKGKSMRLFTYIVAHDAGFAPNPFWGYCTLATCKPRIRNAAKVGDWILGLSPKACGNKLVYAMRVAEKLTFDSYFNDPRFTSKKPKLDSEKYEDKCGDNIYYLNETSGEYQQLYNLLHRPKDYERDTSSKYVLISAKDDFYYYGKDAVTLAPELLQKIVVKRAHRSKFDQSTINEVLDFITSLEKGIQAEPRDKKTKI